MIVWLQDKSYEPVRVDELLNDSIIFLHAMAERGKGSEYKWVD